MKQRFIFVLILCFLLAQGSYSQMCGNNVTEVGQTCDDGDTMSEDGCDQNCQLECGNSNLEPMEECDDGNRISLDGCDQNCQNQCGNGITEGNEQCDDGNPVANDACDNFCNLNCGNFEITGAETCDDGNRISGDGCSSTCLIQACGNSMQDFGQGCDDGNTQSGDGCSSPGCQIQPGYICPPVGTCVLGVCGDGTRATGTEECDDGNTISGDGCSSTCRNEVCGNGILDSLRNQACDDGNTVANDGCAANCATIQPNFACPNPGQPCISIATCGNSRREGNQQCDDGNTVNGDGCTSSCTLQVCGNGVIEGAEECDDGNTAPNDGCSTFCDIEAVCGNSVIEDNEECDDGNTVSNDGCSSICQEEGEVICINGQCNPITAFCGNGVYQFLFGEACDDGNKNNGDGCSSTCQIEGNFICRNQFFPSVCTQCGNRVGDAGQACDDGNFNSGDGCSSGCVVENGWTCSATFPSVCTLNIVCGNGVVQTGQQCDDGNTVSDDGCSSTCMVEVPVDQLPQQQCLQNPNATFDGINCNCKPTFTQMGTSCACLPTQFLNDNGLCERIPPPCGNGAQQPSQNQECDDGNNVNGDGCNSNCFIQTGWTCFLLRRRSICRLINPTPGPVDPVDPVDPTPPVNLCGNGVFQAANNEQCDDGNLQAFDGCSPNCNIEANFNCANVEGQQSVCTPIRCGNGILQPEFQQQCDDSNRVNGDGCSSTCQTEPGFFCVGTSCLSLCGNGVVDRSTNEQCDDGNRNPGDGCGPTCQIQPNFSCVVAPQGFSVCRPSCGNGIRQGSEQCDDFNVASGDGCSNCVIEPGWTCTENQNGLSICTSDTVPFCGNGVFELVNNEQCDDGNNVNTDGCSNNCVLDPNFNCVNVPGQQTQCGAPQPSLVCLDPAIQLGNRFFPASVIAALSTTSVQATTYAAFVQELVTITNGVGTIDTVKARQAQVALTRAGLRSFWAGLFVILTRCAGQ